MKIKNFIYCLLSFSALISAASCTYEPLEYEITEVPEGEFATVSLNLSLPDMSITTRVAGLDPNESKTVRSLWVGIYSARTGERTGEYYGSTTQIHNEHNWNKIAIDAKSGRSYIVAVGNPDAYNGYDIETGTTSGSRNLTTLLRSATTWEAYKRIATIMADPQSIQRTSDNFLMSGIYLGGETHSNNYSYWLDNETFDPNPVSIAPGMTQLPGKVHLRRLVSYLKFNIKGGNNIKFNPLTWQIYNLPGVSFIHERHDNDPNLVNAGDAPIKNLPSSFSNRAYHESLEYENSAFISERDPNDNSLTGSYSFDFYQLENKHKGLDFSGFTELELAVPYHYRELEYKIEEKGVGDIRTQENTGWYRSLITPEAYNTVAGTIAEPKSDVLLRNNNATYVVITAEIDYYYRTDKEGRDINGELTYAPIKYPDESFNTEGNTYDENHLPDFIIHRNALSKYIVHLGYCEGSSDAEKARDFNCRRNTQYFYDLTIEGVDKIRVEAVADNDNPDERYPGAEGTVTDVIGKTFNLDSHYGVFNLRMSDEDRMNMIWRIQSPFGDEKIDMVYDSKGFLTTESSSIYNLYNREEMYQALPENQFYNWIQIRPTTRENVLAHYPGDPRLITRREIRNDDVQTEGQYYNVSQIPGVAKKADDPGVWYLDQLNRPGDFPHPDSPKSESYLNYLKNKDSDKTDVLYSFLSDEEKKELTKERWYTFFIDEYVYEYPFDANKNSLTGWNATTQEKTPLTDGTILDKEVGVAYIDDWRNFVNRGDRRLWIALSNNSANTNSSSVNISPDLESIYMQALYQINQESIQTYYSNSAARGIGVESLNESYVDWADETFNKGSVLGGDEFKWKWSEYSGFGHNGVSFDTYDLVDGLKNQYMYVLNPYNERTKWWEILNMDANDQNTYSDDTMLPRKDDVQNITYYIPDHVNEYMAACLARNRDLNNDGVIGANEIRWYLPTSATLSRVVLGGPSLRSPLFNLQNYHNTYVEGGTGASRTHYMGSDKYFLWAEEFTSILMLGYNQSYRVPMNLRCVRNLGQHMNLSPHNGDDGYVSIDQAYNVDKEKRIIKLEYYRTATLRDYEPEWLPPHSVASALARASRQFQYAKEDCKSSNTDNSLVTSGGTFRKDFFYNNSNNDYSNWISHINENDICGNYWEEPSKSDKGTWRVPNITEVATMYYLDIIPDFSSGDGKYNYASCTYEYFIRGGNHFPVVDFFGLKFKDNAGTPTPYTISATAIRQGSNYTHIRCVKDIL